MYQVTPIEAMYPRGHTFSSTRITGPLGFLALSKVGVMI
jgi:hypothetical protein